jgi:PBSX family phage terminase large subunit
MGGIVEITIPYKPTPIQKIVHQDKNQYIVLNWGRQSGKSTFVMNEMIREAMATPKGRFWIVAPTYKQAKAIYWKDHVKHFIPKQLIKKMNETELSVEFVNGATIEFKGADNEDSLRGSRLHGVALDEYAFMKPHVWDTIISAMLNTTDGRVFFISTPNGFDHFHEMCVKAQKLRDWSYYHCTSYDNPYSSRAYIESKRLDLPDDVFAQEYLADFTRKAGLVYKEFDKKLNVVDMLQPESAWTKFVAIDFGQINPTAVLFIGVDHEDNLYIYDEIYEANLFTSELAHLIKVKTGGFYITTFYGDQAASQSIKDLSEHGIYVMPVSKKRGTTTEDYFKGGIEKIRGYLKVQEGTGKPKLFVAGNCKNTIDEFEAYSWKEVKEGDIRNKQERPEKSHDHCMDALRYFIYEHKEDKGPVVIPPMTLLGGIEAEAYVLGGE